MIRCDPGLAEVPCCRVFRRSPYFPTSHTGNGHHRAFATAHTRTDCWLTEPSSYSGERDLAHLDCGRKTTHNQLMRRMYRKLMRDGCCRALKVATTPARWMHERNHVVHRHDDRVVAAMTTRVAIRFASQVGAGPGPARMNRSAFIHLRRAGVHRRLRFVEWVVSDRHRTGCAEAPTPPSHSCPALVEHSAVPHWSLRASDGQAVGWQGRSGCRSPATVSATQRAG